MRGLSVGIAGCGVAGLALGALLARDGHRVTLFDRLETPRPLGSGLILQPVGLAVLRTLGVEARLRRLGARIERLFGKSCPGDRTVLDVRYSALGETHGVGAHRGALFNVLFETACAAGVALETGRDIIGADAGAFVFSGGGRSARFDLPVDALGVRSPLSRPGAPLAYGALWANVDLAPGGPFDLHALEQRYERARRMVGMLPIGRLEETAPPQASFFWSLRARDLEAWRTRGLDAWKADVRALWPATDAVLGQIRGADDLVFASYAHRTLASPIRRDLVHVGDSYRCTSPQLGQGANMALLDAWALAQAIERSRDLTEALETYAGMRRWHTLLYQSASFLFTPVYQSDDVLLPFLRDRIVAPLTAVPPAPQILAALVSGQIGAPLSAIGGRDAAKLARYADTDVPA